MANAKPFDETLYRLVEQDDTAASAAEMKSRIDTEPEFAAAFDRTRKTVLALQGLAPKPADRAVGTFTQRDFDRLTRGVLKGYRAKYADLMLSLGKAYILELPVHEAAIQSAPQPAPEVTRSKIDDVRIGALSIGGIDQDFRAIICTDLAFKAETALSCVRIARQASPRRAESWIWEGIGYFRLGRYREAHAFADFGLDLATGYSDVSFASSLKANSFLAEDRFEDQVRITNRFLEAYPSSRIGRINLACGLVRSGCQVDGVKLYLKLFSETGTDGELRKALSLAFESLENFDQLRPYTSLVDKMIKTAEIYLGGADVKRLREVCYATD